MKTSSKKILCNILDCLQQLSQRKQLRYVDVSGTTNTNGWAQIPNVDASKKEVVSVVSLNAGGYVTQFGKYNSGYVVYLGGNSGSGFRLYGNTGFQVRVYYYDI